MKELLESVDRVASKIPLDGNKTLFFLALKTLLPLLASFIPGFQPVAASVIVNNVLDAGIALGAAHKAAKMVVRKEPKKEEE